MTLLDIRKQSSIRNAKQTLTRDITPLLKLLYNNNLHIRQCLQYLPYKIQITKIQTIYKLLQIKKLPTYQHEYPVLLRKSAPTFSLPGMSSTLKEYSCTATAHRNTRSFWYDASFRYFKGLWSVWRVNLLPAR